MSHFTTIDVRIKDITALESACAELHLTLLPNTHARGYSNNRIHGDYVIRLNGPYDAALQRQSDGSYSVTADLWNGDVEKELGKGFCTLKQLYGVHKATLEAQRRGLHVRREKLGSGVIRLALCHA